ncbi:sporulation protein YqfC [Carboxydothermus pertinax]|uniref:Sporulation protein YqfC n=1 Tax=Carboxydothermus pertinax TaxID=870242 RepID=A0A1L8CSY9_9THEO|nr:sporulation protein YqfC [Carboxydothermus pertinax]GAV22050.1 sporulation protein YqfC [Carboxydothermus pertinax]
MPKKWTISPGEIFADLPRVVFLGSEMVIVEGHKGILAYSPEVIKISRLKEKIILKGKNLEIFLITPDELQITGQIERVCFERG